MPYSGIGDLPDTVKVLPSHGQEIFLAAFNSAYGGACKDREDQEECAFKIAWAAVKQKYEQVGDEWRAKDRAQSLNPETTHDDQIRELSFDFTRGKFEEKENGALVIHDVPLLAEGVWTDSVWQTALNYTQRSLSNSAGNWTDTAIWSRHERGVPRNNSEWIGNVINPHFGTFAVKGKTLSAVMGDISLHAGNQNSRDYIEMVKNGLIRGVSVEHGWTQAYNPVTRQNEAESLTFRGLALVREGACRVCTLRENEAAKTENQEDSMEIKELEEKFTAFTKELETVKAEKTALEAKVKELEARKPPEVPDHSKELEQLKKELEELKKQPAGTVTLPTEKVKELEPPEGPRVIIDRKNSEIYTEE